MSEFIQHSPPAQEKHMDTAIQDLIKMHDIESLYEVMTENDDFMYCLDAAEGLVMLGDPRGIEFLTEANQSEDEDISAVAREILDSPDVRRKREDLEVDKKREHEDYLATARKRLQDGKKVFIYKTVYLSANFFLSNELSEDGEDVPALNDFGFEGWEVAAFVGKVGRASPISANGNLSGGFFVMKKELAADETSGLDGL
jgi:hypothetical protein